MQIKVSCEPLTPKDVDLLRSCLGCSTHDLMMHLYLGLGVESIMRSQDMLALLVEQVDFAAGLVYGSNRKTGAHELEALKLSRPLHDVLLVYAKRMGFLTTDATTPVADPAAPLFQFSESVGAARVTMDASYLSRCSANVAYQLGQ